MPAGQLLPLLRCLRTIGAPAGGEGDRALLERFARQRDGEAFAALVRRHGPMVLAVCRRLLRHNHDADDAFQAVFLLLVRKAGSLRRPERLGPWLHGVARRVALKARALGPRRRELPLAEPLAGSAEASVPPALVSGALRALVCPSAIPSHVTVLTEGVCQAMLMEKLRFVVMALVAAAALGALALGYRSSAGEPPAPAVPPVVPVPPTAPEKDDAAVIVRSQNFAVAAPSARVARIIADAAERCRKEKAVLWLGEELPAWGERCPITVQITAGGGGGATTFNYADGKVASRAMHVEGPLDRLLSSVLPHEVTHTVFADIFGAPVPRWADEGGCVMSEDEEEQQRNERHLREIVEKGRLIPLPRLLGLKDYPDDVTALFVEGHSLTGFLVEKRNRKTFLAFVKQGMKDGWESAAKEHYGYRDLAELEADWMKEVRKGPKSYPVVEYSMPVERTGLPEGPLPGTARLQADGKGVLLDVIQTRMHYRWTFERARDGTRKNGGLRPLVSHEKLEAALPLSEVKAYQLDGTAIDAKKLLELLKKETPVLVTLARSGVHERWLPLVKEGTLVIEVKAADLKERKDEPPAGR